MKRWWAWGVACAAVAVRCLGAAGPVDPEVPHGTGAKATEPWPVWTRIAIRTQPGSTERLRVDPRGWVRVEAAVDERPAVPGRLRVKGTRGSLRAMEDGPSFTLVLDRAVHGFGDTRRLHLENGAEDPQSVRAAWASHVFARSGIPCPRHGWGTVRLDGRDLGWRGVKEGFDGVFARRAWPGSVVMLGEPRDGADVGDPLEWKDDEVGHANGAWKGLGDALARGGWMEEGGRVDVPAFLRFAAVEVLMGHRDGYALARNNYRVAWVDGRFEWVPWGLDTLMETPALTVWPSMAGSMARAVHVTKEGREAWLGMLRGVAPRVLDVGRFDAWRHECEEVLRGPLGAAAWREWQGNMGRLRAALVARAEAVGLELARGMPTDALDGPGVVPLAGWKAQGVPPDGGAREVVVEGREMLQIEAGARNSSAWATTVRLAPGGYSFRGRARVEGFLPLGGARHHGAALRVAGRPERSRSLQGGGEWTELRADFRVDQPGGEVSLVCELRAGGGRAWFDRASLLLERME